MKLFQPKQPRASRKTWVALIAGIVILGAVMLSSTMTEQITIPLSNVSDTTQAPLAPDDLKPTECSTITIDSLFGGHDPLLGGPQNDLLLGDATTLTMKGKDGNDCIVGGENTTRIDGDDEDDLGTPAPGDNDICIKTNPATTFVNCEHTFPL